ncbi:MAG: mechanosensitive ion channel [Coriobacteriia bacterium]|nr:mechanosensitive ion channel [Coriobacteriia bacterium]
MIDIFGDFYKWINNVTGSEIAAFFVTAAIIILTTMIVCWIATRCLRRFLTRDKVPLPSMSIYLNIVRFTIWAIGISILLATCFGINVTGIIAALGVGGIAISLGFKDTISNLISGVQVSTMKIMKPGDHIEVSGKTGTVADTTWRHTTIENMYGEKIVVPNSVINSNAIVIKQPFRNIRVHIQLHSKSEVLSAISTKITDEVKFAVEKFAEIDGDVKILFTSIVDSGAKGTVVFKMKDDIDGPMAVRVKDIVIRVIAPYVEEAKK